MRKYTPSFEPSSILSIEGFNKRFEELLPGKTQQRAYQLTEEEVQKQYNHRKYANFESFKSKRSRWMNSKSDHKQAA